MTSITSFDNEKTIERRIILDLPNVKVSYKKYCENIGANKLKELASDKTQLNLVRFTPENRTNKHFQENPFLDFQLLDLLYGIKYTVKSEENKTFSISAENYLLYSIMNKFAKLGIPQYRKYELSQQLRYDIDEVFYSKIMKGRFGLRYLEKKQKEEDVFFFDYVYSYIKYNRNVKYFRGDEMTKHGYKTVAKEKMMGNIKTFISSIHYKERKSKNYLMFYLLYLAIYQGVELYIVYENEELVNCFKICDNDGYKKYIDNGCTILSLYDILMHTFKVSGNKDEPIIPKGKMWCPVFDDILEASEKCKTFTFTVSGSDGKPMLGQIDFIHTDISKYEELKEFTGEFGGVIPMKGRKDEKVLDGKKKLNYKKARKGNDNL